MSKIKFSKATSDRASLILREYQMLPSCTTILWEIAHLEHQREARDEVRQFVTGRQGFRLHRPLSKHDESIAQSESILSQHGVTDDLTAIAYMEEIEPKLEGYLSRYQEMEARHLQELDELNASFV